MALEQCDFLRWRPADVQKMCGKGALVALFKAASCCQRGEVVAEVPEVDDSPVDALAKRVGREALSSAI